MPATAVMNSTASNRRDFEGHMLGFPDHLATVGYTPEGWLNDYALSCGYREQLDATYTDERGRSRGHWLNLDKMNEDCYTVRYTNFDNRDNDIWESFLTVEEARRFFIKIANDKEMA